MYKTIKTKVSTHGFKIDKAIKHYLPNVSRRSIRKALDSGYIIVNNRTERFASRVISCGDIISINILDRKKTEEELIKITEPFIIYEDPSILVINKPPFVLSQKTCNPKKLDAKSLIHKYFKEQNRIIDSKLILCHRLDKETSGVLVFAKSKESAEWIMSQFKERNCKKTYEALCYGVSREPSWTQKNYLSSLDNKEQKVKIVNSGGKTAITCFKTLKRNELKRISLIECQPLTGRSHQIRVQLTNKGLGILGDKKYSNQEQVNTKKPQIFYHYHLLHSKKLKIKPNSTSDFIEIKADYSPLFKSVLEKI